MRAAPAPVEFATVADGVHAQVVRRTLLPAHLDASAHEGRVRCTCRPLMAQLTTHRQWPVVPRGTREACTQEEHDLQPLRLATWPTAPAALAAEALAGRVDLTLTMCAYCGVVEVRDVSYHVLPGAMRGRLEPRRRSDVLGWYSGKRPAGRVYV
jgi:hypothetical protein